MWGIVISVPCTAMAYVVDCYRPLAGETMTILTALKNTICFGVSFGVIPWIESNGYLQVRVIKHLLDFPLISLRLGVGCC